MSTTTYSNLHCIPTKKIIEILDNPHYLSSSGKDFGPVADELRDILWERQSSEKLARGLKKLYNERLDSYNYYLDATGVPPFNKDTHPEYFKNMHNDFLSELL